MLCSAMLGAMPVLGKRRRCCGAHRRHIRRRRANRHLRACLVRLEAAALPRAVARGVRAHPRPLLYHPPGVARPVLSRRHGPPAHHALSLAGAPSDSPPDLLERATTAPLSQQPRVWSRWAGHWRGDRRCDGRRPPEVRARVRTRYAYTRAR